MTSVEVQFRNSMLADSAVSALIGTRLFWTQKPQSPAAVTYPCSTYQRISTQRVYSQDSLQARQGTLGWCRFQITTWADGPTGFQTVDQVCSAFIAAMRTFNLSAQPASPTVLRQAPNFVLQQRTMLEAQTPQPLAKAILDLKVWFQELE